MTFTEWWEQETADIPGCWSVENFNYRGVAERAWNAAVENEKQQFEARQLWIGLGEK